MPGITQSTLNSSKQIKIILMRQKSEAVNDQRDENPNAICELPKTKIA
jgi:hypothetical protein